MATTRSRSRSGRRPPEWRELLRAVGGNEAFADYLLEGRRRFLRGEAATVEDVRQIYERVARQVRQDVERLTPGTLRRSHQEAMASRLEARAAELRQELLQATQRGIRIAANTAVDAPRRIALESLGRWFRTSDVAALFADVAERATLALLARTGPDGLRLSDRVWRIGEETRGAIQRIIEDAVARGEDARTTARRLEQYLQPGIARPLKLETRRQLKVPADVSMQALRLAVTEVQHAHHEASIAAWSALPSYQGVYWRLSSNHPVEDICDEYARHGGDGFWPAGDEPPKPHPWCRCYVVPKLEPVEQLADRIRAWIEEPTSQPDLERWYQETARRIMGRPSASTPSGRPRTRAQRLRALWAANSLSEAQARQAIKDIVDEAEQQYLAPLFDDLDLQVRGAQFDEKGVFELRLQVGGDVTTHRYEIPSALRKDAEKAARKLLRAKTSLERWKALREFLLRFAGVDPMERRRAWSKFVGGHMARARAAWGDAIEKVMLEADEADSPALQLEALAQYVANLTDEERQRLEEGVKLGATWLRRFVRGPVLDNLQPLDLFQLDKDGRAYYSRAGGKSAVYVFANYRGHQYPAQEIASVVVHEFTHHVDLGGQWGRIVRRIMEQHFHDRVLQFDAQWSLASNEWGYYDHWMQQYMGRVYGPALGLDPELGCEIPTVVMQWLAWDLRHQCEALLHDPETTALVIGLLKGVGAGGRVSAAASGA